MFENATALPKLEATTFQVFAENGYALKHLEQPESVIFLSVLIEDMAYRLNGSDPITTSDKDVQDLPFFGGRIENRNRNLDNMKMVEILEEGPEHPDYSKYYFTQRDISLISSGACSPLIRAASG